MKKQSVIYSVLLWGTATMSVGGCAGGEDLSSDDISPISSSTSAMKRWVCVNFGYSEGILSSGDIVKLMEDEKVKELEEVGKTLKQNSEREAILNDVVKLLVENKKARLSFVIKSMKLYFEAGAINTLINAAKEELKNKEFLYVDGIFENLESIQVKKQFESAIAAQDIFSLDAMLTIVVYQGVGKKRLYSAIEKVEPYSKECIKDQCQVDNVVDWVSKLVKKIN